MEAQVFSSIVKGGNFYMPQDVNLMEDIRSILKKHKATKRFGVTLLQEDFEITTDEVLIETTNMKDRTQMIKPYKSEEVKHLEAIETSWRLDTGRAVMNCKCVTGGPEGGHQHYSRG